MKFSNWKILLLLIFIISVSSAQYIDASNYTVKDGLPINSITAIYQDYHGFMWIASSSHLLRFDGKYFEEYDVFDGEVQNLIITDIVGDSTGLYLVSNHGLGFYDLKNDVFRDFGNIDTLFNENFNGIVYFQKNSIWILGKEVLLHFNSSGNILEKFNIQDFAVESERKDIFIDGVVIGNILWLATSKSGIFEMNLASKEITPVELKEIDNNNLKNFFLDKNNNIWIGTRRQGVFEFDPKTRQVLNYSTSEGLSSEFIGTVAHYSDDYMMIGTWGAGVNFLNKINGRITTSNTNDYLKEKLDAKLIYCSYVDRQKNLWIGTFNDGLYCIYSPVDNIKIYDIPICDKYVKGSNVKTIRIDKNDIHYIGTKGNGLIVNDRKKNSCKNIKLSDDFMSNYVTEIVFQDSLVWIGTRNGLVRYNKDNEEITRFHISYPENSTQNAVYNFTIETDSTLLITHSLFARFHVNTGKFEILELENEPINFLRFINYKGYWVGTSPKNGIYVLDKNLQIVKTFFPDNSVLNTHHSYDIEEGNGALWIATYSGIFKLDEDLNLSVVDTSFAKQSIITDMIYENNSLWCGTNNGLFKYEIESKKIEYFTEYSNLPFLQFNWWSGAKDSKGEIYLCTKDGLIFFDPEKIKHIKPCNETFITSIRLLNPNKKSDDFVFDQVYNNVYGANMSKLHVRQADIFTIQFATNNYLYPINNQFAYKLDGLDKEWTKLGNKQEVTYHHLPKGHFTFRVKCTTDDSDWNTAETVLNVVVLPYFWNSLFFKIMFLLGTLASIYSLIYYRNYVHTIKENELKDVNNQLQNEISGRQEIEEELIQSNSLLNSIMNAAQGVAIIATDSSGKISYFNHGAELLLGYLADEVIGKVGPEIFHDNDEIKARSQYIAEKYNYHTSGIQIFTYLSNILGYDKNIWTYITKDRQRKKVDLSVTIIKEGKDILGYLGVAIDITKRLEDEKHIKENERKLSTLFGNIQGMAYRCLIDERWTMKYISPGVFDLTGYKPEELIDNAVLSYNDLVLDEHGAPDIKKIMDAVNANKPFELSYRIITKEKIVKWVWEKGCGIFDESGKVIALEGFITDVSENILIKTELEKTNKFIDNIINSMPQKLVAIDKSGFITNINKNMKREITQKMSSGNDLHIFEAFPYFSKFEENIKACMENQQTIIINKNKRKLDDEFIYEDIIIYPLFDREVVGIVIMLEDITEKVRLEEIMVQSEKMLSVGGLAAGMAHEINNPLAGMMQNASVLKSRLLKPSPKNIDVAESCNISMESVIEYMEKRHVTKQIDLIMASGQRASEIVKNMLSFSRKGESKFNWENPAEMIDQTLEIANNEYNLKKKYDFRKINIERNYQDKLPVIMCEKSKLQQVFLNILKNGAEAMYEENIILEKKKLPTKNSTFSITIEAKDNSVVFYFADNGPGISNELKQRVFEPFFTTKETDKGTGLGLSVSYFIVKENHKGEMYIDSETGKGTTFVITIPIKNYDENNK